MSNDKPAPTDAQILAACEEAGLWPNTAASWVANGAFARYHAAINRMLAAEAEKQAGPVASDKEDAERYRLIRTEANVAVLISEDWSEFVSPETDGWREVEGYQLDAAIDKLIAARAKEQL